jgi:hypothetical protein
MNSDVGWPPRTVPMPSTLPHRNVMRQPRAASVVVGTLRFAHPTKPLDHENLHAVRRSPGHGQGERRSRGRSEQTWSRVICTLLKCLFMTSRYSAAGAQDVAFARISVISFSSRSITACTLRHNDSRTRCSRVNSKPFRPRGSRLNCSTATFQRRTNAGAHDFEPGDAAGASLGGAVCASADTAASANTATTADSA